MKRRPDSERLCAEEVDNRDINGRTRKLTGSRGGGGVGRRELGRRREVGARGAGRGS